MAFSKDHPGYVPPVKQPEPPSQRSEAQTSKQPKLFNKISVFKYSPDWKQVEESLRGNTHN